MRKVKNLARLLEQNVAHRMNHPSVPHHMMPGTREVMLANVMHLVFQYDEPSYYKAMNMDCWINGAAPCECCVAKDQKARNEKWNKLFKTYEPARRRIHHKVKDGQSA